MKINSRKINRRKILIEHDDIICCPPKNSAVSQLHPRVYLNWDIAGEIICPYCGTHYASTKIKQ